MSHKSQRSTPAPWVIILALAVTSACPRLAQGVPASATPALDTARTAFEALPEPDRKAVQDALIWTGHYSGLADGTFGQQTFEAVAAYQRQTGQAPNGVLSPATRAALISAAQQTRSAAGFTIVDDPKSGARLGVPSKILTKQDVNPNGGSRWQSADGKITLDTRTAPPDATLPSLYERNIAVQTPGRVVTYKIIKPNFFVVAGETPTGKFYSRYAAGAPGIRAFSIGYDKALAATVDRLVVSIANSFVPFPSTRTPPSVAQDPPLTVPAASQPDGRRLIGTGLVIGARRVLTTAPANACATLQVAGLRPRQITGKDALVLEFASDLKARPQAFVTGPMQDGDSLLIAAFSDEGGSARLTVSPGSASSEKTFTAPLQPGASGAPALNAYGTLVGLVGPISSGRRKIAGIVPSMSYDVVPASQLADRLAPVRPVGEFDQQKRSTSDLAALAQPALVPIFCDP